MAPFHPGEVGDQVEIRPVAHNVGGTGDGGLHLRGPHGGSAGADARYRKPAFRRRDPRHGAGDPRADLLLYSQNGALAGGGERGRFRDACSTDGGCDRRGRVGHLDPAQRRRIEQAQRQFERCNGRLIALEVECRDSGQRSPRQSLGLQRPGHMVEQKIAGCAALQPDAQDQAGRMQQQLVFLRSQRPVRHAHRQPALIRPGQRRQPPGIAGLDFKAHRLSGDQGRHHGFRHFGIGERPARPRIVQRHAEQDIACRRHGGLDTERPGDPAGQAVGAPMAAEQRHHGAAVFRDRDDRRLFALVGQKRREPADGDTGSHHGDDRLARLEPAFHLFQRQGFQSQPFRQPGAASGQHEGDRHSQALPRLCRRMVEK